MIFIKRHKILIAILAAAVLLLLIAAGCFLWQNFGPMDLPDLPEPDFTAQAQAYESVADPSFSLNGEGYPHAPILQDFINRGWTPDGASSYMGDYSKEGDPSNIVIRGYNMVNGDSEIEAALDMDECRDGLEPPLCHLDSLSLIGDEVDSLCVDGKELSGITADRLIELFGEPDQISGAFYEYSLPEEGISHISLSFPRAEEPVAQIMIIFD